MRRAGEISSQLEYIVAHESWTAFMFSDSFLERDRCDHGECCKEHS